MRVDAMQIVKIIASVLLQNFFFHSLLYLPITILTSQETTNMHVDASKREAIYECKHSDT